MSQKISHYVFVITASNKIDQFLEKQITVTFSDKFEINSLLKIQPRLVCVASRYGYTTSLTVVRNEYSVATHLNYGCIFYRRNAYVYLLPSVPVKKI